MTARRIVADRFPGALGAVLGGSTARGGGTATSDLDIVVLLSGPPAPMRSTERHHGRLVEFFVHTEESLLAFLDRERRSRRSPLLHMLAVGRNISDPYGHTARLQELARQRWDVGPDPLDPGELEDRRYRLTALLDDLADTVDAGERTAVAATVFTDVADLVLVSRGRWSGSARWLVRRLRRLDPELCRLLLTGFTNAVNGDAGPLLDLVRIELDSLGGPLDEGYERRA